MFDLNPLSAAKRKLDFGGVRSAFGPHGTKKAQADDSASVHMAAVTMSPVVTRMSRIAVCLPPTVARVRVTRAVVLTVCVRIKLGAPARIVDDVLRRGRAGKRGQQG